MTLVSLASLAQLPLFALTDQDLNPAIVPGLLRLLVTIAVFVVPFFLGKVICNAIKQKEYGFKLGVVLTAATLGVMPFVFQYITGAYEQAHYRQATEEWNTRKERFDISEKTIETLRAGETGDEATTPGGFEGFTIIRERDVRTQASATPAVKPAGPPGGPPSTGF